ncbi:zinc finger BED domain-containing protein RICESLEEPER 2-like protein [Tanacetum coccineum]
MANQGSSSTTGVGSSSAPTIVEILPCKRNPEIWSHYNLCKMSDNTQKAQCIHCFNFYSTASNSTLRAHFTHPHCVALKTTPEPSQPSMGRDGSVFVYNPDYLREQFAGLVISRGLPFNHFDHEETTTVFQNTMQPRYNHVSRSTLKRDAMKLWATAKQLIIDGFLNLNARVNITTDVWSAGHGLPGSYLCVTAHWIEPSTWQMMKRVIAFEDFSVPHTGGRLARMLRNTFVRFNLEDKVLSITLDNASNNTSAIDKLKLKYEPPMEGRFYHSRCVAHIINLVVQEGLKESMFPVISRMAMDVLSVQATSVASESVFSTSGRVLSIRRTKLTPSSLEMCMCLKDHLDAQKRKHISSLEGALDFGKEILTIEVQDNEATHFREEITIACC